MTSIIKVDQIQLADGSTPTIGDLGVNDTGTVLQFKKDYYNGGTLSWSGSSDSGTLYGANVGNRTYTTSHTITITPKSTSSILYCTGFVGWTSMQTTSTGAFGSIITLNDTTSIDNMDYPFYPLSSWSSVSTPYWLSTNVMGTFEPNSTSEQTIRLRPYVYREAGTFTGKYRTSGLFITEIAG